MTTVFFVRHGQSQANARGVYAGISDPPLTKIGQRQAQQAAQQAKELGIATIISSDLERAYQTAVIIAEAVGIDRAEVVRERRLREVDVGKLTGKKEPGAPGTDHLKLASYGDYCRDQHNEMEVEYLGDVQKRMEELVASLSAFRSPILLVGHDMSGRVLRQVAAKQSVNPQALASLPNARIFPLLRRDR